MHLNNPEAPILILSSQSNVPQKFFLSNIQSLFKLWGARTHTQSSSQITAKHREPGLNNTFQMTA